MKAGVLVISNDRATFDFIKPHLVLLRSDDTVYESDYNDAISVIEKYSPKFVILHCGYDLHSFSKLLHQIKIPVIALFDEYNPDYLMTAYDLGVSDFITKKSSPEEILTRAMWILKEKSYIDNLEDSRTFLQQKGFIDEKGFYTTPFDAFPHYLKKYDYGTLILITGQDNLEEKLVASLRDCDIKAHGHGKDFYLFLPDTDIDGAVSILKKLGGGSIPPSFYAGICSYYGNKEFSALNSILENALSVAIGTNKEYIIIDENLTPRANWIEKISEGKKNFKLFKQEFNKMLELVLTPVFYQVQTKYDGRYFNTEIFQQITPELALFKIQSETFNSEFRLKSSGFSAITIDINHDKKQKRITIDLNDLEPKTLEVLLEEFVAEHRFYVEELC